MYIIESSCGYYHQLSINFQKSNISEAQSHLKMSNRPNKKSKMELPSPEGGKNNPLVKDTKKDTSGGDCFDPKEHEEFSNWINSLREGDFKKIEKKK